MTYAQETRFNDVLSTIQYKDWKFRVGGHWWMQVVFWSPDLQHGRKWLLSEHMTRSEIIQTAFAAVLAAEEHECREHFLVEGVAVLGPHLDLFALIAAHRTGLVGVEARSTPPAGRRTPA